VVLVKIAMPTNVDRFVFIFASFIGNCWIRNGRSLVYHAVVLTILKYRKNFISILGLFVLGN